MTARCIAVANTKGGVGKSTIATNLAALLCKTHRTLLIDADPQRSAAQWGQIRGGAGIEPSPTVIQLSDTEVFNQGKKLTSMFDVVLIDTPGSARSVELTSALMLAQHVIVPLNRSGVDSAAFSDMHDALRYVSALNENLSVHALLSRIDPRRSGTDEMIDFVNREYEIDFLRTRIFERVAYVRAWEDGQGVAEVGTDKAAAEEIQKLVDEVSEWL